MTVLVRTPKGDVAHAPRKGGAWTCTVCGHHGVWTDDHQWFGALSDIDGGARTRKPRPIVVTCSDLCRDRADRLGLAV